VIPLLVLEVSRLSDNRLVPELVNVDRQIQAATLYLQGLTLREVGARLGVSHTWVRRWLVDDLGFELRRRGPRSHPGAPEQDHHTRRL